MYVPIPPRPSTFFVAVHSVKKVYGDLEKTTKNSFNREEYDFSGAVSLLKVRLFLFGYSPQFVQRLISLTVFCLPLWNGSVVFLFCTRYSSPPTLPMYFFDWNCLPHLWKHECSIFLFCPQVWISISKVFLQLGLWIYKMGLHKKEFPAFYLEGQSGPDGWSCDPFFGQKFRVLF